ncbi:MAG: UxaA family hydrolase [Rhodospirillales bacterium]|jgi:altronate dehydratase large subunit
MIGYLRPDGRKGVRDIIVVVYLVECAHFVAREIASAFAPQKVQVIGFPGCYPNDYAFAMMRALCTHPNVGAVALVSLGCEGFDRWELGSAIAASGRPTTTLTIQETGGTRHTIEAGRRWVATALESLKATPPVPLAWSDLIVGTICGGSDGTSGITANPAIGRCFDSLIRDGAACIFTEAGELVGCEEFMASRSLDPAVSEEIYRCLSKAATYDHAMGHGSFAPGNAEGGLTTQEEKSMGAYAKSGDSRISGVLRPCELPTRGGLFLVDDIPEGKPVFGYPNVNDNAKLAELIACGAQILLFSTGRGSVVGSAISPVVKICANPDTFDRLSDDMDINAGAILSGASTLDQVGVQIRAAIADVCRGVQTRSEALGHQEFILSYKTYGALGPSCLA